MIVRILFIITLASITSTVALYAFSRIKYKESVDIKNIFAELHGVTSFDEVISVLLSAIRARGYKTYGFFKKNATTGYLESGDDYVPIFTKSAATKAFFKMQPVGLDKGIDADKAISERLGKDIVFVPLSMQQETACWQQNQCERRKLRLLQKISSCLLAPIIKEVQGKRTRKLSRQTPEMF